MVVSPHSSWRKGFVLSSLTNIHGIGKVFNRERSGKTALRGSLLIRRCRCFEFFDKHPRKVLSEAGLLRPCYVFLC